MKRYFTKNEKETKKLGEKIGKLLLKEKLGKTAKIVLLSGELGSGKTTFLKGFAKSLGITDNIVSPTFIIMRTFTLFQKTKFQRFYHIDCYRINRYEELLNLGLKEIIKNNKNIVAIEWPEMIKRILPKQVLNIQFKIIGKRKREILIQWQKDC